MKIYRVDVEDGGRTANTAFHNDAAVLLILIRQRIVSKIHSVHEVQLNLEHIVHCVRKFLEI